MKLEILVIYRSQNWFKGPVGLNMVLLLWYSTRQMKEVLRDMVLLFKLFILLHMLNSLF